MPLAATLDYEIIAFPISACYFYDWFQVGGQHLLIPLSSGRRDIYISSILRW